jgi:hypothetical protein
LRSYSDKRKGTYSKNGIICSTALSPELLLLTPATKYKKNLVTESIYCKREALFLFEETLFGKK